MRSHRIIRRKSVKVLYVDVVGAAVVAEVAVVAATVLGFAVLPALLVLVPLLFAPVVPG